MFMADVWGTVGDWVGGIGSSGALLWGMYLFKTDRDARARAHIDGVGMIITRDPATSSSVANITFNVAASQGEVLYPEVLWLPKSTRTLTKKFRKTGLSRDEATERVALVLWDCVGSEQLWDSSDKSGFVKAGTRVVKQKKFLTARPRDSDIYLKFFDYSGKLWIREWPSGKYVTRRQDVRRIYGLFENDAWDRAQSYMLWRDTVRQFRGFRADLRGNWNPLHWGGYWYSYWKAHRKYFRL